jgi:hypothetical protein
MSGEQPLILPGRSPKVSISKGGKGGSSAKGDTTLRRAKALTRRFEKPGYYNPVIPSRTCGVLLPGAFCFWGPGELSYSKVCSGIRRKP